MSSENKTRIKVTKNGPYEVTGSIPLDQLMFVPNNEGASLKYEKVKDFPAQDAYHLCRCGKSDNKPYCTGAHLKGFEGKETANHRTYDEKANYMKGEFIDLMDAEEYCAGARFCDTHGGTWGLVTESSNPASEDVAMHQCTNCPSGRLTAVTKEGKKVEIKFPQGISVLEDSAAQVHGPLWAKGRITIEDGNGRLYPERNRVTLCRCGLSSNKPFCDGTHLS